MCDKDTKQQNKAKIRNNEENGRRYDDDDDGGNVQQQKQQLMEQRWSSTVCVCVGAGYSRFVDVVVTDVVIRGGRWRRDGEIWTVWRQRKTEKKRGENSDNKAQ